MVIISTKIEPNSASFRLKNREDSHAGAATGDELTARKGSRGSNRLGTGPADEQKRRNEPKITIATHCL
jgi:hypothetical protein